MVMGVDDGRNSRPKHSLEANRVLHLNFKVNC